MDERVLKKIEYDVILGKLEDCASSAMGKAACASLRPDDNYERVNIALEQTAQAETALGRLGRNPVDAFTDVRPALKKAPVTLSLSQKELLQISKAMRAVRLCKESLQKEEMGGHLRHYAGLLVSARHTEEEIQRCILSEDEMADHASPLLSKLRQQMRGHNEKVREKLNQMLHGSAKSYLQDPIITLRNGRYVLPVKQEHRNSVPGLLHDQSGSGATLFIEPMAVVELGNELKRLEGEEREEIERILSALTQMVAPDAEALAEALLWMAQIDLIFAKARLAGQMRATRPHMNNEKQLRIPAGRHPLIDPADVVPIDIWLGEDFRTLIITGPNTGGKTVTLKTVGLFAAMAQSGLFLPAATGTHMPVFDAIYADIGDEQSIEQSLSTFSAHMKNIVYLLRKAEEGSLVLLDELGSGTDPVEGAALAMSILEELDRRNCLTLATTHYSELKAFALTREGMENASMEFDVATLKPTYRLFVGIPGKSNAFEISQKLGLGKHIIERAGEFLSQEDIRFEDVISSAESQRRIAEQERQLAEEARQELHRMREQTEKERQDWEKQKQRLMNKAKEESRKAVEEARQETERIVKELRQSLKENADSEAGRSRAIQGARDALRQKARQGAEEAQEEGLSYRGEAPSSVQPGQEVYLIKLDQNATVLSQLNDKEAQVQAGIIKLTVKLKDLRAVRAKKSKTPKVSVGGGSMSLSHVSLELDLRGERVEDALIQVERYLDDARIAGLNEVTIIHGKGTGALRSALHEQLRREPGVKSFRIGAFGEGDAGVTVVQLR